MMADNQKQKTSTTARRAADPIGEALRRLHDEVAAEPVPQEFLDLLDEIDARMDALSAEDAGSDPA